MALILIHPEYRAGSDLCPVCNARRGEISVHSLTLCHTCGTAAIGHDPRPVMMHRAQTRYLSRALLMLVFGIMVVLFDVGYAITQLLRAFRHPAHERHANHTISQRRNHEKLYKCTM